MKGRNVEPLKTLLALAPEVAALASRSPIPACEAATNGPGSDEGPRFAGLDVKCRPMRESSE